MQIKFFQWMLMYIFIRYVTKLGVTLMLHTLVISFMFLSINERKQCGEWISCPFNTRACILITWHAPGKKRFIHSFIPDSLSSLSFFIFALLDAPKPPAEDSFIMPDEFVTPEAEGPGRARRSPINSNRVGGLNVETLVVADRKMLEKHGRENVTTYVLTVMNMVSVGRRWKKVWWDGNSIVFHLWFIQQL